MLLTIHPQRRITLPEGVSPSDHILLIPGPRGSYRIIPAVAATEMEFEEAVRDDQQISLGGSDATGEP